jgi:hypothetical protein
VRDVGFHGFINTEAASQCGAASHPFAEAIRGDTPLFSRNCRDLSTSATN